MSLYQPGDLIFTEYSSDKRLVCDGSAVSELAYPLLREAIGNAVRIPPINPVSGIATFTGSFGYSTAFSHDGAYLAVGHSSGLTVLDTSDWSVMPNTPAISSTVNNVAFSPDRKYLSVTGNSDPVFTMIDTETWTVVTDFPTTYGLAYDSDFSPDGLYFALAVSASPYLRLFSVGDWVEITISGMGGYHGRSVAFSPNGEYLATGQAVNSGSNAGLVIVRTSNWSVLPNTPVMPDDAIAIAFSPDGEYLAIGCIAAPNLIILDTLSWSPIPNVPAITDIAALEFSPDGHYLAVGRQTISGGLSLRHTDDWGLVSGSPGVSRGRGVSFTPDSSFLAVACSGPPAINVFAADSPPPGYFFLPTITENDRFPGLPVLIQSEEA